MTQTPDNSSSNRFDRIEAALEQIARDSREEIRELHTFLTRTEGEAEREQRLQRLDDILASLQAGQEKQDRLLDYIMRRTNGDNA